MAKSKKKKRTPKIGNKYKGKGVYKGKGMYIKK